MKTCPHGKEWWPTKELADAALKEIWSRPRPGGRRMETNSYRCPDCGHFHLTSRGVGWVPRPSQSELWRRHQLALDILKDVADGDGPIGQARRVLLGEIVRDGAT